MKERIDYMRPGAKAKKKNKNTGILIIGTIFVAIIIILLIFLMQSKTTTSGEYPENIVEKSLNCTKNESQYPFLSYDNALKKTTAINLIFLKDKPKAIYLKHSLYYDDSVAIKDSEAHNHAAMNMNFAKDNLGPDALNITYSRLADRMQISLYIESDDFNKTSLKYFLIDVSKIKNQTLLEYKKEYISLGFTCEDNN